MQIIAALFLDDIQTRPVPGPSTRLDLSGVQFSAPAPAAVPVSMAPHLVVIVWCPPGVDGFGALEVVFRHQAEDGTVDREAEPLARNVQPLQIEPGKFNYRLVRAELEFTDYGTVVAECRMGDGPVHPVPFTVLPPVD